MVIAKGKGNTAKTAKTIVAKTGKTDAAKTTLTEAAVSSPEKTKTAETVIVSEAEEKVELKVEEVVNGEKEVVVATEEAVISEENNEDNAMEEEDEDEEEEDEEEDNEENSLEEENNEEETMEEEKAEEEKMEEAKAEDNTVKQNKEKVEEMSKGVGKKLKKGSKGKGGPQEGSKAVVTRVEDKPKEGSKAVVAKVEEKPKKSDKNKAPKKVESMGMVFMCNSKTKRDCYRHNILGLPASKKDLVQKVYKGMRLFLYDFDKRLMYGIYKAAGRGGYDIVPKAFNSLFPAQVRFTVLDDCLPLAEEKFKKVLKENYYSRNKFDCQLTSKQVKELCKLFIATRKGATPQKTSRRSFREEKNPSEGGRIRGGRIKRRVLDTERPSSSRRDRDRVRVRDRDRVRVRDRDADRGRERSRDRSRDMDRDHRYSDRPVRRYERESPRAPPPLVRIPPLSYTYEMEPNRVDPYLEPRAARYVELPTRRIDEPYASSYGDRESISYRNPVYPSVPEYPLASDYRPATRVAEYPPEYRAPPSLLRPEYRLAGTSADYLSSAALSEDYRARPLYRY